MKKAALTMFVLLAVLGLTADDAPGVDITTVSGQTYANATVVNVNAASVDIAYLDNNNMPVMRCLKLKDLTPELQAKFNYDPAAATESELTQNQWQQNQFNQLKNQEAQLAKQVGTQILQRQGGQNIPINLDDLYNVIYEGKTAVAGFVISYSKEGALVNVTGSRGNYPVADNIIILDLDAPAQSNWAGYVYPTMMISSRQLGVYCVQPGSAINSVVSTLKLDDAAGDNNTAAAAVNPVADANSANTNIPNNVSASPAAAADSGAATDTAATSGISNIYIQGGGGYYSPGFVYPAAIQPYVRPWPHPPYPPYQPHPLYNNNNNWSNRGNFNAEGNRDSEIRANETTRATGYTAPHSDFSGRGWGSGGGGGRFRR